MNLDTKDETLKKTSLGSVCEKDWEAVVERDLKSDLDVPGDIPVPEDTAWDT